MGQEDLTQRFGKLVRRLRKEKGYSQEELAFRVALHWTYMGDIERGEKNVTLVTADKLAKGLGLTLAGLLVEMERGSGTTEDE